MATLQQRLLSRFLVMVLVPMAVLAAITIWIVRGYLRENLADRLESGSHGVDIVIDSIRDDLFSRGSTLARDVELTQAVALADRQTALDILTQALTVYSVEVATVADARGVALARAGEPGHYDDVVTNERHWARALEGVASSSIDENELGLGIEITLPLTQDGELIGALRLAKSLDHRLLSDIHEQFGLEAAVYQRRRPQATTFTNPASLGNPTLDEITGRVEQTGAPEIAEVRLGSETYLVMVRPIASDRGEYIGAYHLAISTEETGQAAAALTSVFVMVAIFLGLVAGLVSNRVASNIVRPVRQLLRHARSVAQGDLDSRIDVTGTDEISELMDGFNLMSSELKATTASIDELNREITERIKLEERLRQSEKMQVIGQIAGGVAHDFNNQLHIIGLCAEQLRSELADPALRAQLETLSSAVKRSSDLTRQLLAFSRKAPVVDEAIEVKPLIETVASLLERVVDRKVEIKVEADDNGQMISGDRSLLQNALFNLGLNARDAIEGKGVITFASRVVHLEQAPPSAIVGDDLEPGDYVRICVEDDGTGMTDDVLKQIFEPFFTTKGSGTGLGLSAVYGTVGQHGGALTVRSAPGRGTTFAIFLRAAEHVAEAPVVVPAEREPTSSARAGHVMLVDDEEGIIRATRRTARIMGYRCTAFTRPTDAIAWYRDNWQSVDLVILDMILPELDGAETFEVLKSINPETRAILATGFGDHAAIERAREAGLLDSILKPFRQSELESLLRRYVENRES